MHCKQWLDKTGIWDRLCILHIPNERMGSIGTIMHFKRMGVREGAPDWFAFPEEFPYRIRQIAIEMKTEDGVQSDNQKKFQKMWEAAGHLYFIARTLEEFQAIIRPLVPEELRGY